MLVSLVEEMTCKWERQLEDAGEGKWTDDMLAREGTDGERKYICIRTGISNKYMYKHSRDGVSCMMPFFSRELCRRHKF